MYAKKSLGQHWLDDQASLDAMVKAADIQPGDEVLEIGPGQGSLTRKLLEAGAKVSAIEKDENLARQLSSQKLPNLHVIEGDILTFNFAQLSKYKIAANVPYYLSAHLFRILTEISNMPKAAALLVQKEVAERVCAMPGNMSVLSVAVQLYYMPSLGKVVPAELFKPPPKVDSQILKLKKRPQPLFNDLDDDSFFKIVKAGFSEKRKKLRSSLSGGLRMEKTKIDEVLASSGINGDLRAQNLSLEDWYSLYKQFSLTG